MWHWDDRPTPYHTKWKRWLAAPGLGWDRARRGHRKVWFIISQSLDSFVFGAEPDVDLFSGRWRCLCGLSLLLSCTCHCMVESRCLSSLGLVCTGSLFCRWAILMLAKHGVLLPLSPSLMSGGTIPSELSSLVPLLEPLSHTSALSISAKLHLTHHSEHPPGELGLEKAALETES